MSRKLILALAILAVTTTPALARGGGGFHGGFGFFGPSFYYPYPYYGYAYPYPVYSSPAVMEQPSVVYQQQPPVQREVMYPTAVASHPSAAR